MPIDLPDVHRRELLDACIIMCRTLSNSYTAYQIRIRREPLDDKSPAARSAQFAERKYGPSGSWSGDLVHRITVRALIYQSGAQQYLDTMHSLVQHHPYGLGLGPIVRSMAEICGKVCWLLDPQLTMKEGCRPRVARLLLDELDDATRRKTLAAALMHPDRAAAGDDYRSARDQVVRPGLFFESEIDVSSKDGRVRLRDQSLPSPSILMDIAAEALRSSNDVDGVYGYLSSMTHPTFFAFVESFPLLDRNEDELPYMMARPDALFVAKLVSLGAVSFYDTWRVIAGWLETDFHESVAFYQQHEALKNLIDAHSLTLKR